MQRILAAEIDTISLLVGLAATERLGLGVLIGGVGMDAAT